MPHSDHTIGVLILPEQTSQDMALQPCKTSCCHARSLWPGHKRRVCLRPLHIGDHPASSLPPSSGCTCYRGGKWRGLCAMTAQCQAQHGLRADRFQAYFLARKVRRNYFPHVSTVMWPSPRHRTCSQWTMPRSIPAPSVAHGNGSKASRTPSARPAGIAMARPHRRCWSSRRTQDDQRPPPPSSAVVVAQQGVLLPIPLQRQDAERVTIDLARATVPESPG
jgi:hypothetical protein